MTNNPPEKRARRGCLIPLLVIGVIIAVAVATHGPTTSQGPIADADQAAPPEPTLPVMPLPADEAHFLAIVEQGRSAYEAGANDMAKGASRPRRARALCAAFTDQRVADWLGSVKTLSSSSDGKGVLMLRLGPHLTVGTTNNSLSDSLTTPHTLIEPDSPVFAAATALRVGQMVRFSGVFPASDTDCLEEGSITQEGSMTDPEFRMSFDAVAPAR